MAHHGRHDHVAAAGIDLLARAQRPVDQERAVGRHRHLAHDLRRGRRGGRRRLGRARGRGGGHVGHHQAGGAGRGVLGLAAAAHRDRLGLVARQQAAQGLEIERVARPALGRGFRQLREIDDHRFLFKEIGGIRQLGVERLGQHAQIGRLEDDCDQRQRGALEFEYRPGARGGNIGHWKTSGKRRCEKPGSLTGAGRAAVRRRGPGRPGSTFIARGFTLGACAGPRGVPQFFVRPSSA